MNDQERLLWTEHIDYMELQNRVRSENINTVADLKKFLQHREDNGYQITLRNLYLEGIKPMTLEETLNMEKENYDRRVELAKERFKKAKQP